MSRTEYISLNSFEHLQDVLGDMGKECRGNIRTAWRKDASKNLRPKLRKEVERAFGGKKTLARSYAIKVRGTVPVMFFYSKAEPTVSHEYGDTIRPVNGKYLAIPTGIGQKSRKGMKKLKGYGGKLRLGPRFFKSTFVVKGKSGSLVVMQKGSSDGTKLTRSLTNVTPRGSKIYDDEALPLFVLKRSVKMRKRTGVRDFAHRHTSHIASVAANAVVWGRGDD